MVTRIGGADHVHYGGIRLSAKDVDALRRTEVQADVCLVRPARLARRICTSASSGAVETPDRNVATRLHSVGVTAESTDGGSTHGCGLSNGNEPIHIIPKT
jgi:hypothetical protein